MVSVKVLSSGKVPVYIRLPLIANDGIADRNFQALQKAYSECKKLIDDMVAANPDFIEVHSSYPGIREEFAEKIAMRFPNRSRLGHHLEYDWTL